VTDPAFFSHHDPILYGAKCDAKLRTGPKAWCGRSARSPVRPLTDVIELIEDDQQSKQMLRTIIDDELATIKWLALLSASSAQ
jgi:hypothetical protein